jgi:hypothetical protein
VTFAASSAPAKATTDEDSKLQTIAEADDAIAAAKQRTMKPRLE